MPRALILVLDSVGIGGAPDAHLYEGADTVGHIADACARGQITRDGLRSGRIELPVLSGYGLGLACELATGRRAGYERRGHRFRVIDDHVRGEASYHFKLLAHQMPHDELQAPSKSTPGDSGLPLGRVHQS
jgi:hypothetical protein